MCIPIYSATCTCLIYIMAGYCLIFIDDTLANQFAVMLSIMINNSVLLLLLLLLLKEVGNARLGESD